MYKLSPFQDLPLHIAEAIASYYINTLCSTGRFYDRIKPRRQQKAWKVLYNVSYSWRTLALSFFCSEAIFSLASDNLDSAQVFRNLPYKHSGNVFTLYPYVKIIRVSFDNQIGNVNQMAENLLTLWPEDLTFPCGCSLIIYMNYVSRHEDNTTDLPVSDEAVKRLFHHLVHRIQSSMPHIRSVQLGHSTGFTFEISANVLMSRERDVADFLTDFFYSERWWPKADKIQRYDPANDTLIQTSPGFASIECTFIHKDTFRQIIVKSAPVLKSFKVHYFDISDATHFLYEEDGRPLTYPMLDNIELCVAVTDEIITKPGAAEAVVPFPVLRRFIAKHEYPFADDTPFRGNSDTLETLDIDVSSGALVMLHDSGIFANGRFSKLHRVLASNYRGRPRASSAAVVTATIGIISPATRFLSIGPSCSYQQLISNFSTNTFMKGIQALSLENTGLALSELLNLIKSLPNLTGITILPGNIDSELQITSETPVPDDFYAAHYPASQGFKCWVIPHANRIATESIVLSAIFIAVLCPSFRFVGFPARKGGGSYKTELEIILESGAFDKHKDRIQWLLLSE